MARTNPIVIEPIETEPDPIFVAVPDVKSTTEREQKTTERKPAATVTVFAEPAEPEILNMTTIWTPPCNSVFHLADAETETCLPPDASPKWITDGGYYSPGICFGGYTSDCGVERTGIKQGQTAAMCVPRYGPLPIRLSGTAHYLSDCPVTLQPDADEKSGWKCGDDQRFATNPEDDTQTDVPAFEIRWEEDDLSLLETHPQTPEAITTSEPTGDGSTDSNLGPTETSGSAVGDRGQQNDDAAIGGISRCTVVGIAVGVPLAVILLCAVAFYWYRRRYLKPPPPPPKYDVDNEKTGGGILHSEVPRTMGARGMDAWNTPVPRTPMAELCAETTLVQHAYASGVGGVLSPRELDEDIVIPPPLIMPNRRGAPGDAALHGARYSAGARSQAGVDYAASVGRRESVFQNQTKVPR